MGLVTNNNRPSTVHFVASVFHRSFGRSERFLGDTKYFIEHSPSDRAQSRSVRITDFYSGFDAKTEEYDYKFLGEKSMLSCVNAEHSPEVACRPTDGGASACPKAWEMRHL